MPLTSLARSGLVDQTVDALLTMISENDLQPGDVLPPQAELMAKLEIGRTSLREAIQRLVALGALDVQAGKRMAVGPAIQYNHHRTAAELERSLRRAALLDMAEMRDLIEPEAATLAAQRATEDQIRQLKAIVEQMRTSSDPTSAFTLNVQFHSLMAQATQNDAVRRILGVAMDMLSPLHQQMYERLAERVSDYHAETEHTPILEALIVKDGPRARHAMRDHIKIFSKFISDTYGPEAEPGASQAEDASDSV